VPAEIERKFLVLGTGWRTRDPQRISQGYLSRDAERTVRVRIADPKAYLTVKGRTTGASRAEFEYEIPLADAEALLALCDGPRVEKLRHRVRHGAMTWEVDEFLGENRGLVVAEIELESEAQAFARPVWLGTEVTQDPRYFNSNLAAHPFTRWAAEPHQVGGKAMREEPVRAVEVEAIRGAAVYPAALASATAGRGKRRLGDVFGLANFGVNLTTLDPGAASALFHWHARQDEFIYVLEGNPTLCLGEREYRLSPGDCVGFRAGSGTGHQLVNRTADVVSFLEVGDRTRPEQVSYPRDDLAAAQAPDGAWTVTHKDGRPY
jgi:adenylate cyclase